MAPDDLAGRVRDARERLVDFCARLVRAPSMTGDESEIAGLVRAEMHALGLDVSTDAAGNVIGCLHGARGRGGLGRSVMLHAHMDIVDPGEAVQWTYGPYAGEIADGHIWGRGAVDDKGCIAAQVYAAGLLHEAGIRPPADLFVAAVVGEEIGGLGSRYLVEQMMPGVAIIGEPSNNTLRRGHRGRFEFIVTLHGRSAHASTPHEGLNPHYTMSRFLLALRDAPMAQDGDFGATTVVPTLTYVDQSSSNVIPAALSVHLDWRNAPGETVPQARALVERILADTVEPGIRAEVRIATREVRSYTGMRETIEHAVTPFWIAADDPRLLAAQEAVSEALGRQVPVEVWPFYTDGGFLHAAGIPCIGFGPGDPAMAHVVDERLPIAQLLEATAGYMALALRLSHPDIG
jgi:succinyl-diaminopimelate desuccinylase